MAYSSGFVHISEDIDFQFYNVLYNPSTRNDPSTFKNSEPIAKTQL